MKTLELFETLNPILDREGTRDAYRLEVDLLPMVLEMRRRGIRIDQDAAEQARDLLLAKRDAALAEISEQHGTPVGMDEINGRKWKEKTFEQYGIAFPRTEKGNPSFSAGKSGWMATHPHWLPQGIAIANKYEAAGTKFLEGHILKHIVGGRIHAEIHPFRADEGGTRSSRFSYSNPPLQQMPVRDKELGPLIRSVFLPEEGEIWCKPDQAQQEFRWLVGCAAKLGLRGSAEAVATYRDNPDADFHAMVAEMTGLDRDAAKSVNFAKIYGAGVKKLAEMIGKPVAETQAIVTQYDRKLPFVAKLAVVAQETAVRVGYTELYDGARRHWNQYEVVGIYAKGAGPCGIEEAQRRIADPEHAWFGRRPSLAKTYTALNAMIQGSAARHTKLWMRACYREGIVPMLQMHDALDTSVTSREQGELIARLGEEAVKLEVPMRVDVKYGRSWGDAKHTWEELGGAAPAPKPAPKPQPKPAPSRTPEPALRARANPSSQPKPHAQAHLREASAPPPACRRRDPQTEGGAWRRAIQPDHAHERWTDAGHFKLAIRSPRSPEPLTAAAAGDRAHPVHQGRRAAHQADLPGARRHAGERRLGLRDGARHGRARQGCRRCRARRVDRRPDAVTGARARRLACGPA